MTRSQVDRGTWLRLKENKEEYREKMDEHNLRNRIWNWRKQFSSYADNDAALMAEIAQLKVS